MRRKKKSLFDVQAVYLNPFHALEGRRSSPARPRAGQLPITFEDPAPLKNPVPGFNDRLKASAEAKKAMLAKFQPKAAAQDPDFDNRHAEREAEVERIRAERAAERQSKKDAIAAAERQKHDAERKSREDADQARRLSQREQLMAMYGRKRGG